MYGLWNGLRWTEIGWNELRGAGLIWVWDPVVWHAEKTSNQPHIH